MRSMGEPRPVVRVQSARTAVKVLDRLADYAGWSGNVKLMAQFDEQANLLRARIKAGEDYYIPF